MPNQNFKNHRKFAPLFHYGTLFPTVLLLIWAIVMVINQPGQLTFFLLMFTILFSLNIFHTRIFSVRNQDRIIRMEMRYRYYLLVGKRFEPFEDKLNIKQIVALRFASDEELDPLIQETIEKNLKPDEIKKKVKNWQSDFQRV